MLSRCTKLGIARATPPCISSSANYRRRTRVIAKASGHQETFQCMHWNFLPSQEPSAIYCRTASSSAQQSANIRRGIHQGSKYPRHIGDTSAMFSTWSCKYRRCIFDVITSRMIWVIHRWCSRTVLWSIGNAMAMFSSVCSIFYLHPVICQQNKSDLFFIHDLIR